MGEPVILVLGGYGRIGRHLCRLLCSETKAGLVVAGPRDGKAWDLAWELDREFGAGRITAAGADASDRGSLRRAFKGVSLVAVTSPTAPFAAQVAGEAVAAGADYLDCHFDPRAYESLKGVAPDAAAEGRTLISQAGLRPGLPAVMVRFAAPHFEVYRKATVGMAVNERLEMTGSVWEMLDSLPGRRGQVWRGGRWRQAGWRDSFVADLGPRFGRRRCRPAKLEEMRLLPAVFGLDEVRFGTARHGRLADWFCLPAAASLGSVRREWSRKLAADLLLWGLNADEGPVGASVVLEAEGEKGGKPLKGRVLAEHGDACLFTAISLAACLRQWLGGAIAARGLVLAGNAVEPGRFMEDMRRMGVFMETRVWRS